jgi:serine/threonine protein kinase
MGVVYRGHRIDTGRTVALKTVRLPSPRWLGAIRREIETLTRIRHPGIVRVVDYGEHDGLPWYAMDLLEGESLRHYGERLWSAFRKTNALTTPTYGASRTETLDEQPRDEGDAAGRWALQPEGPFPAAGGELPAVLAIVRRLCEALAYLHGEGLVNCDLKPENILLIGDKPVLIDFGLAARHPGGSGREAIETQQAMAGTLPYISPEQIRGEFVDARADLYSVGCLLYELVTSQPPFVGSPSQVVAQHLTAAPRLPSTLVSGLPPKLEELMLKLLEKRLADRVGFADQVGAILTELLGPTSNGSNAPAPAPYLYRPSFVGRTELVKRLISLRERAANGSGSFVLLGGESGAGKTRIAMELTRVQPAWRMRLVVGESAPMAASATGAANVSPLHALRPLLIAIADRCREGGAEVIERMLGYSVPILAQYEPSFSRLQTKAVPESIVALSPEASRRRLFRYLSHALSEFARERPLLWVLDDLLWADELSLEFLKSLTKEYLEATPILIVGTYRVEAETRAVGELKGMPHLNSLLLPSLEPSAVESMIADMLALRESWDPLVSFVTRQSEGNPFFVVEYVRTAVAEAVLYRGADYSWQIKGFADRTQVDYAALPLPRSIQALIGQRLAKLTKAARLASFAAAVMGREAELETLSMMVQTPKEAMLPIIAELLRGHVMIEVSAGLFRFAHDKLREFAYAELVAEYGKDFHGRAGDILLERFQSHPDAQRQWATIGRHFAFAERREDAAKFLRRAADHSRATHANGDALQLYQEAIHQAQLLAPDRDLALVWQPLLAELYEACGDMRTLTGEQDEARVAYNRSMVHAEALPAPIRSRLYRKIGKTWEARHEHHEALNNYSFAKASVATDGQLTVDADARNEWIQAQIEELWVHYWLNRVDEMKSIVSVLRPLIATDASASQRNQFFQTQMLLNFRSSRYVVTEEALGFAREAVAACRSGVKAGELYSARLVYGLALLFNRSFLAAEAELVNVAEVTERAGDIPTQARSLAYLSLCTRMRGMEAETRGHTLRTLQVARSAGALEYIAASKANQAWLAQRERNAEAVKNLALEALEIWDQLRAPFPFRWMALIPLLQVRLEELDTAGAVSCARALLEPHQQFLPGAAADALTSATLAIGRSAPREAEALLDIALKNLEKYGYC